MLALVVVLQFAEGLSDRQAADAVRVSYLTVSETGPSKNTANLDGRLTIIETGSHSY
jgi:hypothetical protein